MVLLKEKIRGYFGLEFGVKASVYCNVLHHLSSASGGPATKHKEITSFGSNSQNAQYNSLR
jgi:hypothetical protein